MMYNYPDFMLSINNSTNDRTTLLSLDEIRKEYFTVYSNSDRINHQLFTDKKQRSILYSSSFITLSYSDVQSSIIRFEYSIKHAYRFHIME